MYNGKFSKPVPKKRGGVKWLLLLAALALMLTAAIGGSLAWLQDEPQVVQNTFTPGEVPNHVEEKIEGNVKNDVSITNDGNVDAYIRAAVIVNWVDEEGNISGTAPVYGTDYSWDMTMDGWKLGEDGYYYHLAPLASGESTGILFTTCEANEKKGLRLSVEIMGQSIQALGVTGGKPVVAELWDSVTGIHDDLTLMVKEAAQ